MPSLATRLAYSRITLAQAETALAEASQAVSAATEQLEDLADGELELDAIRVGGVRFIQSGGGLVAEP